MSLLTTIGKDITTLFGKLVTLVESEAAEAEAIVNAFLPILPTIEKELATIIASATAGAEVTAAEELMALIIQIKSTVKSA